MDKNIHWYELCFFGDEDSENKNFDEGISVEFCAEDNCDYEDYDYNL